MRMRRLKSSRGSVTIEVAVVSLALLLIVIGVSGFNVHLKSIEDMGRSLREISDVSVQMVVEDNAISREDENILTDMLARRTSAPLEKVFISLTRVHRSAVTDSYQIVSRHKMGGLDRNVEVTLRDGAQGDPGFSVFGKDFTLSPGQEVMVVYVATVFEGVPRGVRSPQIQDAISVAALP